MYTLLISRNGADTMCMNGLSREVQVFFEPGKDILFVIIKEPLITKHVFSCNQQHGWYMH